MAKPAAVFSGNSVRCRECVSKLETPEFIAASIAESRRADLAAGNTSANGLPEAASTFTWLASANQAFQSSDSPIVIENHDSKIEGIDDAVQ